MSTGPIRDMLLERVQGLDDSRLATAWVGLPDSSAKVEDLGTGQLFLEGQHAPIRGNKNAPVLVMLQETQAPIFRELLLHGRESRRVYVLAPLKWGEGKLDPELASCPTVLIRRVNEVPASGVYSAKRATVWMGGVSGARAPWGICLDEEQAEAFRQVFLRLFWHDAVDEAWTSGNNSLSFRPPGARPFDIPELPRTAPVRLLDAKAKLDISMEGALVHLSQGAPPREIPRRLWFPSGGKYHAQLAELVRGGAEVLWEQRDLPDLVVAADRGAAFLPGTGGRLRIGLNASQIADFVRILEQPAACRFELNLRLGDYARRKAEFWLDGSKGFQLIEPEQGIEADAVNAPEIAEMARITPSSWPSAQPLALSVRYRWTVRPPRLPKGTDEDALIEQWRKVDTDWREKIKGLGQILERVEAQRGRVGALFSRLKSAMLGFGQTREGLLAELQSLQGAIPSKLGPSKASALLQGLGDIEEKARKLQHDLEESEHQEREALEREKQKQDWQGRVDEAKRTLSTRRRELGQKEEQRESLRNELKDIKQQQDEQLGERESQAAKDLKVRRQRVTDDLKMREEEIKRLQAEVEAFEKRSQEVFYFTPPPKPAMPQSKAGGRFVPPKSAAPSVGQLPAEALPEVGLLRRDRRHQRYLVIETWEELARAEQAASRLNAKLVAPENA